jgi:hypothetical protein
MPMAGMSRVADRGRPSLERTGGCALRCEGHGPVAQGGGPEAREDVGPDDAESDEAASDGTSAFVAARSRDPAPSTAQPATLSAEAQAQTARVRWSITRPSVRRGSALGRR